MSSITTNPYYPYVSSFTLTTCTACQEQEIKRKHLQELLSAGYVAPLTAEQLLIKQLQEEIAVLKTHLELARSDQRRRMG